jgi:hypothetical protein
VRSLLAGIAAAEIVMVIVRSKLPQEPERPVFKILYLMKRKPGLTHEEFVHYYQTVHSQFVTAASPQAKRYFRKYLRPLEVNSSFYDQVGPSPNRQEFDVVMELWFDSKEQFESIPGMNDPVLARQIMEDEKKFIDVDAGVLRFTYEEHETEFLG